MSENTPEQSTQSPSDEQPSPQQPSPQQHSIDEPNSNQPRGGTPDSTQDATKPVEQWATGDEPATGPQLSYLQTLAREAGEDVPERLTKADASLLIDRLQNASPRVD